MKQRMLGFAVAAIGLLAMPAAADPVRFAQAAPAVLPAYEIVTIVRSAGFVPLSPAMLRGANYVLRATANDGREMRLTVDARRGSIVSAVPAMPAETAMPGERLGPYERMSPPGYIPPPDLPRGFRPPPPVVYEGDRPLIYERRPMEPIPDVLPRGPRVGARDAGVESAPPPPIMREEGTLPPPPERFPQRVAPPPPQKPAQKPAAKPEPAKRAAAPPAAAPLPKPKPATGEAMPPAAKPDAESKKPEPVKPAEASTAAAPAVPSVISPPPPKADAGSLPH